MMLASVADVSAVVGGSPDPVRTATLIGMASDLIAERMGYEVEPIPVPATVRMIAVAVVARALANPVGVESQTAGPFTTRYATAASAGIYLTEAELGLLNPNPAAATGLGTISTTREPGGFTRYVSTIVDGVLTNTDGDLVPFEAEV